MAEVIKMPRMSDTMEEGVIVEWHKKVGESVEAGDILAEVETDKATMELESYFDGTLLYVGVEKGDAVPIDAVLAVIGDEGEDFKEDLEKAKAETKKKKSEEEVSETDEAAPSVSEDKEKEKEKSPSQPAPEPSPAPAPTAEGGRLKASPLARKMAEEKGIDISKVKGSGDNGRIIKRDIESYKETAPSVPAFAGGEEGYEDKPVSQMRKTIARRLSESKFTAPHFYLTMEINMDQAVASRKRINDGRDDKISFNDMIIKAAAAALRKHPDVNVSWLGDKIRYYKHIHVGVAVAIDEGLIVPVLRHADLKGIEAIRDEVRNLAQKARDKKLQPEDWEGNTFTISNLGMYGIEEFTAIINPPDATILAVGGIKKVPYLNDGELAEKNVMKVTLSCDHRAVDGAVGSSFLKTFKEFLEEPVRMLL